VNAAATHEISADIAGAAKAAARLLKFGGKLCICYPAERLSEAFCALGGAGLEPKKLRLVQTKPGARPYLALIRANRGAKPGLVVEENLIITGPDGKYTEEVQKYYNE
jgi:Predicted O-methyltransferase